MMSSKVLCLSYNSDSILHIKKITLAWLWCQTKQMRWPNEKQLKLTTFCNTGCPVTDRGILALQKNGQF